MDNIRDTVITETNRFILSQDPQLNTQLPQVPTRLGIYCFSDSCNSRWVVAPAATDAPNLDLFPHISNFTPLTHENYTPSGLTALYDAIKEVITQCRSAAAAVATEADGAPASVIVIIQTDGFENSSTTTVDEIRTLITECRQLGWQFVFLGANQDACLAASAMGVSRAASLSYTASHDGTTAMTATLSQAVSRYRSMHATSSTGSTGSNSQLEL